MTLVCIIHRSKWHLKYDVVTVFLLYSDESILRSNLTNNFQPIDGLDQSLLLLRREESRTSPLRETNYEYNVVMDQAVIVDGEWKLILGNAGRRGRFLYFFPNELLHFVEQSQ